MIYWGLGIRSLASATLRASKSTHLPASSEALALIVGKTPAIRDPASLQRVCLETLGRQSNDAIIGPLFWFAIGGPAGLWAYKTVNLLAIPFDTQRAKSDRFGRASIPPGGPGQLHP